VIFHGSCVDGHLISVGSKRDETSIDLVYGSSYLCVYRFFGRMKNDEHSFLSTLIHFDVNRSGPG